MKKTIKIGVIGCGNMAQGMHLPNIVKHPGLKLEWCCDIDKEKLQNVKRRFAPTRITTDVNDIANDPSCRAVIIATTHEQRYSLIKLFSEAGKHIYVEKPLANSFSEMFQIARQVRKTGISFCVGHNRRLAPAVVEALRIYRKHKANPVSPAWRLNRLGNKRPRLEEENQTLMLLRVNDDFWSWNAWAYGDGIFIGEMTHFADLACYFIQEEPVRIQALGSPTANNVTLIDFKDGSQATLFAAAVGSFGYPKERIEIYHQGAAIIVDHLIEVVAAGVSGEPFRRVFPLSNGKRLKQGVLDYYREIRSAQKKALRRRDNLHLAPGPDKGHYRLLDRFVDEIHGGEQNPCNLDEAMKSTAVILKGMESFKQKKAISIKKSDYRG